MPWPKCLNKANISSKYYGIGFFEVDCQAFLVLDPTALLLHSVPMCQD